MVKLPHWPVPSKNLSPTTSLSRMEELLSRLGNPQRKLPPVIHIAGTNGKGSTLAFLKAILEDAGYKVHRYTSPHLERYNERIELAGSEIDDDFLYRIIEEVRIKSDDLELTFFEGTTAAALLAFSKVKADICLIETGMGGRLDPTNVVSPIQTIITPISFDHMEHLGDGISKIALEKAGIIKPNAPAIISWQLDEAKQVLLNKCQEVSALYFAYGEDWFFETNDNDFLFQTTSAERKFPLPKMMGKFQVINAATAVASIMNLDDFEIGIENIDSGLRKAYWPGRMEQVKRGEVFSLLPDGWELWVDGAHNPAGAEMLSLMLLDEWQDLPLYLIHGRTKDRDIAGFLAPLCGKVKKLIAVRVNSEPLSEDPAKIAKIASKLGFDATTKDSMIDAVKMCIEGSGAAGRIVVAGSLYLVTDVKRGSK
jgi:dihydrofolate synthase/folylpolyglutamate synthase